MPILIEKLYRIYSKHPTVCTDTRTITPQCLFFALKGEQFDGHQFVQDALQKGAAFAVIDNPEYAVEGKTLCVANVLESLQQLARYHRQKLAIPIVGITGTNGKTTTKELLACALSTQFQVFATHGNLNNHIGVPLSLLAIRSHHQIAIIEMGANHPGEIAFLCSLAQPTHGLITNIGKAHLQGFGNLEGVIKTKNELYKFLQDHQGTAFVNANNPLLMELSKTIPRITYGTDQQLHCSGTLLGATPFVHLQLGVKHDSELLQTQIIGAYNFENIMAALCVSTHFGLSAKAVSASLAGYQPANNRSQVVNTPSNQIILDAYNANPVSMKAAISNLNQMDGSNKTAILGDMFELGDESLNEHLHIVQLLEESSIQNIFLVGKSFSAAARQKNIRCFENTAQIRAWLQEQPIRQAIILIKGSRGMQLEPLVEVL